MTLNITVLSKREIYQSGDFRLVDMRGKRPLADFEAQKQMQLTKFGWSAVVAFAGVGSTKGVVVSEWLAERTDAIPAEAEFQALIDVLLSADEWLRRVPLDWRFHTFSVGAFLGHRPLFAVVSNHESTYRMPSRRPRPQLQVSYLKPRRPRVIVTGRSSALVKEEREMLIALIRKKAAPETVRRALARANLQAAARDPRFISSGCFASSINLRGEGGGEPYGMTSGRSYLPSSMFPSALREAMESRVKQVFPEGAQLRGFTSKRFEASEEYHRVQLREYPNDSSVHNNYGAYLADVANDDEGAERAYRQALELDPNHVLALGNLAGMLWAKGQLDEAEQLHRRAFELEPTNTIARTKLARFLLRVRDDAKTALALCEDGLATQENVDLLEVYCEALVGQKDWERSASSLARLYVLKPRSGGVAVSYAAALHATGRDLDMAESLYRQVLEQEADNHIALVNLAQLRYDHGAEDEAVGLIRKVLGGQPLEGIRAEALFCLYAVTMDGRVLPELRKLLVDGARSEWDLSPVVERSVALGHPEPDLLRVLAKTVAGTAQVHDLDRFAVWETGSAG